MDLQKEQKKSGLFHQMIHIYLGNQPANKPAHYKNTALVIAGFRGKVRQSVGGQGISLEKAEKALQDP